MDEVKVNRNMHFLKFFFESVLFTQYALSDHLNDGRQNLLGAIMIAGHYVIPEVCKYIL